MPDFQEELDRFSENVNSIVSEEEVESEIAKRKQYLEDLAQEPDTSPPT